MLASVVRNSWIDPGYGDSNAGIMTRFPKIPGTVIQPGCIIGFGQIFYFPSGVERPYGSEALASQYAQQTSMLFTGSKK